MGMWEILEEGRDDYGRGFGMRGDEVEEAYKEGCRHGYEKAMREIYRLIPFVVLARVISLCI